MVGQSYLWPMFDVNLVLLNLLGYIFHFPELPLAGRQMLLVCIDKLPVLEAHAPAHSLTLVGTSSNPQLHLATIQLYLATIQPSSRHSSIASHSYSSLQFRLDITQLPPSP